MKRTFLAILILLTFVVGCQQAYDAGDEATDAAEEIGDDEGAMDIGDDPDDETVGPMGGDDGG